MDDDDMRATEERIEREVDQRWQEAMHPMMVAALEREIKQTRRIEELEKQLVAAQEATAKAYEIAKRGHDGDGRWRIHGDATLAAQQIVSPLWAALAAPLQHQSQ